MGLTSRRKNIHGINRSLVMHLRNRFPNNAVGVVFDGYKYPDKRPLITIQHIMTNVSKLSKNREAMQSLYRYQVGLFDVNNAQLSLNQERVQDVLSFDKFPYYDTTKEPAELAGFFRCQVEAVTPIYSDDITNESEINRVYFDVTINDIKRSC